MHIQMIIQVNMCIWLATIELITTISWRQILLFSYCKFGFYICKLLMLVHLFDIVLFLDSWCLYQWVLVDPLERWMVVYPPLVYPHQYQRNYQSLYSLENHTLKNCLCCWRNSVNLISTSQKW